VDANKIIYSTGDPAFAVDKKGAIVIWNRAAESAFGYSASAAEGRHCWNLLRGNDAYGNEYCGRICPLREMGFKGKIINSCRIFFKTASQEFNGHMVSTLVLHNGLGKELIAHICQPETEPLIEPIARPSTTQPSNNGERGALTQREIEVLALIAEGKSTREIAFLLCISICTVRNHVGHILFKLHVHNRHKAVSLGRQLHLI